MDKPISFKTIMKNKKLEEFETELISDDDIAEK